MDPRDTFAQLQLMAKMLRNIDAWLVKAEEHAAAKKFDVNVLLQSRLAPDQWALARQIQAACDAAKFACAYLADKPAPPHPDTESTFPEIHQRIATVLAWLEPFTAADFEGAGERRLSPRSLRGAAISGESYLLHWGTPNFFFHVGMTYAILRMNGVALTKNDYLGPLPLLG